MALRHSLDQFLSDFATSHRRKNDKSKPGVLFRVAYVSPANFTRSRRYYERRNVLLLSRAGVSSRRYYPTVARFFFFPLRTSRRPQPLENTDVGHDERRRSSAPPSEEGISRAHSRPSNTVPSLSPRDASSVTRWCTHPGAGVAV